MKHISIFRLIVVGFSLSLLAFVNNISSDSKHMFAVASLSFFGLAFALKKTPKA